MTKPRLHLDADTSKKSLFKALLANRHDVTRTPCAWMALDASDTEQLLGATAQGRVIFTFNVRDYVQLAKRYPNHAGILLSAHTVLRSVQEKTMPELLPALEIMFNETDAQDWIGQVRWLNDWMK